MPRFFWLRALFAPARRVPLALPPRTPRGVDAAARILVQKIARANAARHAVTVFEKGRGALSPNDRMMLWKLRRRVRIAENFVDVAVQNLRLELGLNLYPTQVECADWGEAP